ncbi:MAG: methylenetetrahydrofolate reductase [NAD(P)H] [Chloroflexi bacterium]|nr:methylenetetrahydrofolate reductase [NAD(P)H] [Chloroflexota bacterium]
MTIQIKQIFDNKRPTFSFEFFPPKTAEGLVNLHAVAKTLANNGADFFSVTYGAGGSTKELTLDLVSSLQDQLNIPVLHHLTCVGYNRETLRTMIIEMKNRGVNNIMALRGDPPKGQSQWQAATDGFQYCYELIDLIKEFREYFCIGVAGFPEGHIHVASLDLDIKYLKMKLEHGGQFIITQFFFDNQQYYDFENRVRLAGITAKIIPGILPIVNYAKTLEMAFNNGTTLPARLHEIFAPIADDKEATIKAGYLYALEQSKDLLDYGVDGIHFYALNRLQPSLDLLQTLRAYISK